MWQLQSPLWCSISKARYNAASLKPVTIRQYFYKILQSPNINLALILQSLNTNLTTISKSPNNNLTLFSWSPNINLALILQSPNTNLTTISKSPNNNLALFYKAQIIIWQLFHKAQNTILAKTITLHSQPKCYFGIYLQNSNIILTFVLHILNPTLMGNIIIHPSRNTSLKDL